MVAKTLALAFLTLSAGQVPQPELMHYNTRSIKIPFDLPPADRGQIRQLVLYVSRDQGQSYQRWSVVPPDKTEFIFHAPADGLYWLRVATIDRAGKQDPENLYSRPPDQKVFIDTLKPVVRLLAAEREGEDIVLSWEIQETHPDPATMKLKYRAAGSQLLSWDAAEVQALPRGDRVRVRVNEPGPVLLRLEIKDQAGNYSYAEKEAAGLLTAAGFQQKEEPVIPPGGQRPILPPPPASPDKPLPPAETNSYAAIPPPPPAGGSVAARVPPPPTAGTPPPATGTQGSWDSVATGPASDGPPAVASTVPDRQPAPPAGPARDPLPPVQFVNKTDLTLEYELSSVGPSGVGKVELFVTRDDGVSWEQMGYDPTVEASMRQGKYARTLLLPGEGTYGFALRVWSRAGLGKAPPHKGEAPEMRVEVDMTPPEATLFAPQPDRKNRNSLTITWEARDRNLAANPVSLEWAAEPTGHWETIHNSLPNDGRYSWSLPPSLPARVYLRLKVRDRAGNMGVAVTQEPQIVDLTEPEYRLVGVKIQ